MKWLLIFLTSSPQGDYAITTVAQTQIECVTAGENLLKMTRPLAVPNETQAYWCWPTSPDQVAYLTQEPSS